jgi:predicted lipase
MFKRGDVELPYGFRSVTAPSSCSLAVATVTDGHENVIAFRGSATCQEWLSNLDMAHVPLDDTRYNVHRGVMASYTRSREALVRWVCDPIHFPKGRPLTIVGHSRGGIFSILLARDIRKKRRDLRIRVYTYGTPCMIDPGIIVEDMKDVLVTNVVHEKDLVAKVNFGFSSIAAPERKKKWSSWLWCWDIPSILSSHRLESYCT